MKMPWLLLVALTLLAWVCAAVAVADAGLGVAARYAFA